jgi:hypothetical protein
LHPFDRRFSAAVLAALGLWGMGCADPCEELAERICTCQPTETSQSACKSRVEEQLDKGPDKPTAGDDNYCEKLLDRCHDPEDDRAVCARLETPQGKIDCGLAYPAPTP